MNCKCGATIPELRTGLGYRECVNCSTVEAHGCIDIIYHKTGNTIQITDKKTAERMRLLSRRNGMGTLRGAGAGGGGTPQATVGQRIPPRVTRLYTVSHETLNKIGEEALVLAETEGTPSALLFLEKALVQGIIFPVHVGRIKAVLTALRAISL